MAGIRTFARLFQKYGRSPKQRLPWLKRPVLPRRHHTGTRMGKTVWKQYGETIYHPSLCGSIHPEQTRGRPLLRFPERTGSHSSPHETDDNRKSRSILYRSAERNSSGHEAIRHETHDKLLRKWCGIRSKRFCKSSGFLRYLCPASIHLSAFHRYGRPLLRFSGKR